jgi:dipeptide/tripeptide permease
VPGIGLFVFAAVFWSAFEEAPTSLNPFAKDFTDRQIGSFEVPAVWFQSVNVQAARLAHAFCIASDPGSARA